MKSCVLLFSGGADSTLCAIQLRSEGYRVHAVSIAHGRRPRAEAAAARRVGRALDFASWHLVPLDGLAFGPPAGAPGRRTSHEGVIPHRNLVYWAIAANRASAIGADCVAAGHTREDGRTYTDASPAFFRALEPLLGTSGVRSARSLALRLPLQELPAAHWRRLAREHRELVAATWSCWRDGSAPCGRCFACRQRARTIGRLLGEEA